MAITIPELNSVTLIDNTDNIMLTHSNGNSEKISGANLKADIVKDKIENNNANAVSSNAVSTILATSTTITGPALGAGGNIKILFTSAIAGTDDTTGLSLTYNSDAIVVKVGKDGSLVDFTAVEISAGTYRYLQAYTTLELVYDSINDYFIIQGNPVVISGVNLKIHANGNVAGGNIGDIITSSLASPSYGWLEANGQAISRTKYAALFNFYSTQTYDSDPTHTLLSKYGTGDGSTTFNLPDYRESVLVGVGQNGTDSITDHDTYTLGQYKDDQVQIHRHKALIGGQSNLELNVYSYGASTKNLVVQQTNGIAAYELVIKDFKEGRVGTTTHGKQKGVNYFVKVL